MIRTPILAQPTGLSPSRASPPAISAWRREASAGSVWRWPRTPPATARKSRCYGRKSAEANPMLAGTVHAARNRPIAPIDARREAAIGVLEPRSRSAGGRSRGECRRSPPQEGGDRRGNDLERGSSDHQKVLPKPTSGLRKAVIDPIGDLRGSNAEVPRRRAGGPAKAVAVDAPIHASAQDRPSLTGASPTLGPRPSVRRIPYGTWP